MNDRASSGAKLDGTAPVLVLGATGLVGRFALERLSATGVNARGVSRRAAAGTIRADLEADPALPPAGRVLALCPIWLLTEPLLHGLADRGLTRLVATSSTSVKTKAASSVPSERAVAARLAEGEARVRAVCEARGVAWTILRPTLIYAEGLDGNVSRLAALIRRFGVLPLSGRGEGLRQPVHAEDLAHACVRLLEAPAAHGRTYAVAGGETLTYRQMVERVFEGLGRRPAIVDVPPALWRLGLTLAAPLLPGATAGMGARMGEDLVFDDAAARADFGWSPRPFRPRFV